MPPRLRLRPCGDLLRPIPPAKSLRHLSSSASTSTPDSKSATSTTPDPFKSLASSLLSSLQSSKSTYPDLSTNRPPQTRSDRLRDLAATVNAHGRAADLERMVPRRWKTGDVYAPHDLSAVEAQKWRRRTLPKTDIVDVLGMNPLDEYKNFAIMSEYITQMGRIRHSSHTGLRPVNQRRMAKAIRRAVGLGLMPSVHQHPEILDAGPRGRRPGAPRPI